MTVSQTLRVVNANLPLGLQKALKKNIESYFKHSFKSDENFLAAIHFLTNTDKLPIYRILQTEPFASVIFFGYGFGDSGKQNNSYRSFFSEFYKIQPADESKLLFIVGDGNRFLEKLFSRQSELKILLKAEQKWLTVRSRQELDEKTGNECFSSVAQFLFQGIRIRGIIHIDATEKKIAPKAFLHTLQEIKNFARNLRSKEEKNRDMESEFLARTKRIILILPKPLEIPIRRQLKLQGFEQTEFFENFDKANEQILEESLESIQAILIQNNWRVFEKLPRQKKLLIGYFCLKDMSYANLEKNLSYLPRYGKYFRPELFATFYDSLKESSRQLLADKIFQHSETVKNLRIDPKLKGDLFSWTHKKIPEFLEILEKLILEKPDLFYSGAQHAIIVYFSIFEPKKFIENWQKCVYQKFPKINLQEKFGKNFQKEFAKAVLIVKTNISQSAVPALNEFRNSGELPKIFNEFSRKIFPVFFQSISAEARQFVWDRMPPATKVPFYKTLSEEKVQTIFLNNYSLILPVIAQNKSEFVAKIIEEDNYQAAGVLNYFISDKNQENFDLDKLLKEFKNPQKKDLMIKMFIELLKNPLFCDELVPLIFNEYQNLLKHYSLVICKVKDAERLRKIINLSRCEYFLIDQEIHPEILEFAGKKNEFLKLKSPAEIFQEIEYEYNNFDNEENDFLSASEKYVNQTILRSYKIFLLLAKSQEIAPELKNSFKKFPIKEGDFAAVLKDAGKVKKFLMQIKKDLEYKKQEIEKTEQELFLLEKARKQTFEKLEQVTETVFEANSQDQRIQKKKIAFVATRNALFSKIGAEFSIILNSLLEEIRSIRPGKKNNSEQQPIVSSAFFPIFAETAEKLVNLKTVFVSKDELSLRFLSTLLKRENLPANFLLCRFPDQLPGDADLIITDRELNSQNIREQHKEVYPIDLREIKAELVVNEKEKEKIKKEMFAEKKDPEEIKFLLSSLQKKAKEQTEEFQKLRQFSMQKTWYAGLSHARYENLSLVYWRLQGEQRVFSKCKEIAEKKMIFFEDKFSQLCNQKSEDILKQKSVAQKFFEMFGGGTRLVRESLCDLQAAGEFIYYAENIARTVKKRITDACRRQPIPHSSEKFKIFAVSDDTESSKQLSKILSDLCQDSGCFAGAEFHQILYSSFLSQPDAKLSEKSHYYLFLETPKDLNELKKKICNLRTLGSQNRIRVFIPFKKISRISSDNKSINFLKPESIFLDEIAELNDLNSSRQHIPTVIDLLKSGKQEVLLTEDKSLKKT